MIGLGDWTDVGTIRELEAAKKVFDESGLKYYVIPGDHDLWDGRNQELAESEGSEVGIVALSNFKAVFGEPTRDFEQNGVRFLLIDNSDIYRGIGKAVLQQLESLVEREADPRWSSGEDQPLSSVKAASFKSSIIFSRLPSKIDSILLQFFLILWSVTLSWGKL